MIWRNYAISFVSESPYTGSQSLTNFASLNLWGHFPPNEGLRSKSKRLSSLPTVLKSGLFLISEIKALATNSHDDGDQQGPN